jgi:hypothetical protein
MATISIIDYIHELKQAGFTDKQSEVQARKLEQIITDVKTELKQDIKQEIHIDDLVTKKDLELAIERIRYQALKFTIWTGVAVVVSLGGMLAKGFHWF